MWKAILGYLTLGLLSACSFTVTVPLPDQTLTLTASNTTGKILYPKTPLGASAPIQTARVILTGEAELSPFTPISLDVYARTSAPSPSSGCVDLSPYVDAYACDVTQADAIVGRIDFKAAQTTSFTLGQTGGEILARGINQGQLWLGVKVAGTGSVNATLHLKNMKATVTAQL
ncbi:MAG: hypothetical protein C4298_06025 [Thermus sp.]